MDIINNNLMNLNNNFMGINKVNNDSSKKTSKDGNIDGSNLKIGNVKKESKVQSLIKRKQEMEQCIIDLEQQKIKHEIEVNKRIQEIDNTLEKLYEIENKQIEDNVNSDYEKFTANKENDGKQFLGCSSKEELDKKLKDFNLKGELDKLFKDKQISSILGRDNINDVKDNNNIEISNDSDKDNEFLDSNDEDSLSGASGLLKYSNKEILKEIYKYNLLKERLNDDLKLYKEKMTTLIDKYKDEIKNLDELIKEAELEESFKYQNNKKDNDK